MSQLTTVAMCSAITILATNAVVADSLVFPHTKEEWANLLFPRFPDQGMVNQGLCIVGGCKVTFATNSANFQSNVDLNELAATLQDHFSHEPITIEGHTDSVGSAKRNLALSKRRAKAVRDYLVNTHQIAVESLIVKGYGEEYPIDTNATAEGRENNRRVEFKRCLH